MLTISNPNAGSKSGPALLKDVTALLKRHRPALVIDFKETDGPGDAGHIARNYLEQLDSSGDQKDAVILISGGDTTVHEVVNQLAKSTTKQRAGIILVPSGTANALYHSMFPPKSRQAFLEQLPPALQEDIKSLDDTTVSTLYSALFFLSNGKPRPLQSTRTSILNEQGDTIHKITSCVVVSSSLHSSILDIAESLRSTHPGIERFKIAAGQSITQWSQAQLLIKREYEIYDPVAASFKHGDESITHYDGPFAYFLTTTNVDRLEQEFRISPLATSIPVTAEDAWMEVVMIRPQRDPSLEQGAQDETTRQKFAATTMKALQSAYQDGSHVGLGYEASGEVVGSIQKAEESVVEYLRVKEWEWVPNKESEPAHLICVDGEVFRIPTGGKATSSLLVGKDRIELGVYGGI